jgi:hypothetical protein
MIPVIKSKRMTFEGQGNKNRGYEMFVGKPAKAKAIFGRHGYRWKDELTSHKNLGSRA